MKILFYGAGVLGSFYAARLHEAGYDVSILARGRRLADLKEHGIVLQNANTGEQTTTRVKVVERLAAEDAYDLVAVIVRKNQLTSVLEALAESEATPDVVFMLNNASGGKEMVEALGRERVILGFPGAGGVLNAHVVRYLVPPDWLQKAQKTTFGELDGSTSPRLRRIMEAFGEAGPVAASPNMDAWLRTHASLLVAIGTSLSATGGDIRRLSRTPDALVLMVRALRENFGVLQELGLPVAPRIMLVLAWLPELLLVPLMRRLLDTDTAEMGIVPHANADKDETKQLTDELFELARTAAVPTPNADRLREYLNLEAPQIPDGSAQIPVDHRGARVMGLGVLGAALVLRRLLRSR